MINVYCEDRGWLFQDLAQELVRAGAVYSQQPLPEADAWICIRTREAKLSPDPKRTVVQVHDTDSHDLEGFGVISCVHPVQIPDELPCFVQPIGAREVPASNGLPNRPTIGWYAREIIQDGKELKRSSLFCAAVAEARKQVDFDVLFIGERLKHVRTVGQVESRAATPEDYGRIDALVVTSVSQMIPISAYEAIAAGVKVISTSRQWTFNADITEADTVDDIAAAIVEAVTNRKRMTPRMPFTRKQWAERQIQEARKLCQ